VAGLPGLMRVSENGGTVEELLPQNDTLGGVMDPWILPGGDVVMATGLLPGPQLLAYSLRNDSFVTLGPGVTPRFVDGYLVYGTEEGVVFAHPFDPERLEFTGDPVRIADRVGGWLAISRDLAISPSGALAYAEGETGVNELVVNDLEGGGGSPIATSAFLSTPRISPDGNQILYGTGSRIQLDIYVASLSQGTSRLLASVPGGFGASWSPDGSSVVYGGGIADPRIWRIDLAGAGEPELLYTADFLWVSTMPNYTWDGEHLVFERGPSPSDIAVLALDGSEELRTIVGGPGSQRQNTPSPTGPWVAYTSDETGQNEVYVVSLDGGARLAVSSGGGVSPRWSQTGDTLFYWPIGGREGLQAAALALDGEMRVVSRRTLPGGLRPIIEMNTLPAQYDRHPRWSALVVASTGGGRIVVRTDFLPSGG
jgi:Tol biopolymer transport system component